MSTSPLRQALQDRWQTLAARERALVRAATAMLALALLWWLALAPALVWHQAGLRAAMLCAAAPRICCPRKGRSRPSFRGLLPEWNTFRPTLFVQRLPRMGLCRRVL